MIYEDLNELPAYNWFQVIKTGDLTYLLHDRTKKPKKSLNDVWSKLNAQFIDEIGISDDYRNYIIKLRAYNIAYADYLINNNNYYLTLYEVAKVQLKKAQEDMTGSGGTGYENKINAERVLGFRLDLKQVNVVEYYAYINEANRVAKSMMRK